MTCLIVKSKNTYTFFFGLAAFVVTQFIAPLTYALTCLKLIWGLKCINNYRRYFSFVLIIACISMSACIAFAEKNAINGATIGGEVIEVMGENAPIQGATVKIVGSDGKEWKVKTDVEGKYEYTGLPAGRYTINVYKRGYNPWVGKSKVVAAGGERFDRIKMRKKDDFETRFAEGLLQHVAEDIGKRYKLDASIVKKLHRSIFEALDTVLEQKNGEEIEDFAEAEKYGSIGFILGMLSHPNYKPAFAKYLTETQLQDYLDFMKARQQQVQQAIAQFMTAFLDQALSLTVNQREKIEKLLLNTINDKPELDLMNIMNGPLPKAIGDLLHNKLHISLDSVLNQTQSKIWEVMIDFYDGKDLVGIETFEVPSENAAEKDEINKVPPKSQKWILAEAILMAHTEQLGTLNESASKRLEIATKGVIQQYLEAQIPNIDDDFKFIAEIGDLMQAFMWQSISRDEAIEKLGSMKNELWGEKDTNKRWDKIELHQITNHPLYQQAIKDVLSEDVYLQYKAHQAERKNFRIQASRNLALAFIDMIVLLNEAQRQQIKMITAQLTIPSLNYKELQMMFAELFIRMDHEILSPWQQSVFKGGR